jgi:hypothetical protein
VGNILPEETGQRDFERGLKNGRSTLQRLSPVCFFDGLLCRRAFGFPIAQVIKRLDGQAEQVTSIHNGILVVATSEAPTVRQTEMIDKKLKQCLGPKTPQSTGRKA